MNSHLSPLLIETLPLRTATRRDQVLAIEMQGLMDLDFDIEDLGFSTVEIDVTIDGEQTVSSKAVRGTKCAGLTCRCDVHSHPR